jgi:hypothetical protein
LDGGSPRLKAATYIGQHKQEKTQAYINVSRAIRTYDPNVGADGNISSLLFFFNSHGAGWSPNWVHSARRPLNGVLYLPRVIMLMDKLME